MKPKITVVPLGPGSPDLMTLQAADALRAASRLILRTARHPAADWLRDQGIAVPDRQARRIIASVFQPAQRVQKERGSLLTSCISNDSTHKSTSCCCVPAGTAVAGVSSGSSKKGGKAADE